MAEYSDKRLYWIKLTDRFMTSDTVDYLMTQPDGANYVVLYQMLCLKTVNQNGLLARQLGEILVPYDESKIQRDCKYFSIDTVRVALNVYKNLGLIYEQDDGILRITDFDRLIGSQTEGAEKKQIQRQKREEKRLEIMGRQYGGQRVDICPPYKEKDINTCLEVLNNNINTTQARARVREEVSIEQFEQEFDCVDWEKYPNGETYVQVRDTLISLINNGDIAMWEASHDLIGEILDSMYKGRERREITDMNAYIFTIVKRKRNKK